MRVHELHDLDSLSRTQLHRGEALALDEDERSRRNSVSLSLCDKGITPSRHHSNCGVQAYPNHPELMELQLVVCTLRHRNREDSGSDLFLTQTSSSDAQRTHGKKFLGRKNRNTKKFCTKFFLRNWILFHRAQQNFRSKLVRQQRRQRN